MGSPPGSLSATLSVFAGVVTAVFLLFVAFEICSYMLSRFAEMPGGIFP